MEAIARKRAALQNMALGEQLDDFARAEPVQRVLRFRTAEDRRGALASARRARFRRSSAAIPKIKDSAVETNRAQACTTR